MRKGILSWLLVLVSAFCWGCAVPNSNIASSVAVYYPKPPQGVKTIDVAEKELATLLMSPVTITYDATQKFPNYHVLQDFIDKTNPGKGLARELNFFSGDPIMMVNAKGVEVSGGALHIPVFPLVFEELTGFPIKVEYGTGIDLPNRMKLYVHHGAERAQRVADLLFFIQHNIVSINNEKLAEFEKKTAQYRSLQAKPKMGEEQRKLIVQANSFNQQKNYEKAIDKYLKAVELDPTSYPAAYHNLALLYAQQNNIWRAIFYMKHYLLLEPDSKDARIAQDKIYEWEAMLEKQ